MANYTINNLPNTVTELNGADTLPVWDSANNKTAKISGSNLSNSILSNLVTISASSTIVSGLPIKNGSCIKIMFTSAITGSDTTTAMTITYNGISIPVKVGKQGSLSNFVASEINSAYYYLQAYTTLELIYDGTQFIIVGNPVVLSSDSYTIYADGSNKATIIQFPYNDTPATDPKNLLLEKARIAVNNGIANHPRCLCYMPGGWSGSQYGYTYFMYMTSSVLFVEFHGQTLIAFGVYSVVNDNLADAYMLNLTSL